MGLLIKDLREGDRVVISISSKYYNTSSSNPPDSVKGTVRYNGSGSVEWDNGKTNSYGDNDLVKVSETAPVSSGLTKTPIVGRWYVSKYWASSSIAKCSKDVSTGGLISFEEAYIGRDIKASSSWDAYAVRLATDEELSKYLPDDHIDNPTRILKDSKRGTPTGTYTPKKGDKVKVVANRSCSANKIGEIGIVDNITRTHCTVKVLDTSRYGIDHYFDDLELVSSKSSTTFKSGDKVRIIANTNNHGFATGDIGYLEGFRNTSIRGGYYWNVDGIDRKTLLNSVRECDMVKVDTSEISKPLPPVDGRAYSIKSVYKNGEKIPIFDLITSPPKVWRVKTKAEMVADGIISSSQRRPKDWSSDGEMDKYFGTTIDPKYYSSIEKVSNTNTDSYNWIAGWYVRKNELTTKPLPFGTVSVEDDDSDDEREGISWESDVADGFYDYDLDKLDEMSKDYIKESIEVWPDMGSPSIYSKRPKTEVVIIPHKSRRIF